MADTFNFKIRAEPSGQSTFRTLTAQFGDGYSQAAADGINTKVQVWNIEARGPWVAGLCAVGQAVKPVADFLDLQQGHKSFIWTPPDAVSPITVACDGYSTHKLGNGVTTLSAVFKEVFRS